MKKTKTKLPPKPKVYDNVERIDGTKVYGYVSEIISDSEVKVAWSDTTYPSVVEQTEKIKDLAITRRL